MCLYIQDVPLQESGIFSGVKLTTPGDQSVAATSAYLHHLRSLNMCLVEWINQHVHQNPFVDLSPVFHDYSQHLASLGEDVAKPSTSSPEEPSDSQMAVPPSGMHLCVFMCVCVCAVCTSAISLQSIWYKLQRVI